MFLTTAKTNTYNINRLKIRCVSPGATNAGGVTKFDFLSNRENSSF